MNQKLLSGLTAALLVSTLGAAPSGYADPSEALGNSAAASANLGETGEATAIFTGSPVQQTGLAAPRSTLVRPIALENLDREANPKVSGSVELHPASASPAASAAPSAQPSEAQPSEVIKVGAYQSQAVLRVDAVATIQSHALQGRQAATLYVRNIPVLTFLGASALPMAAAPNAAAPTAAAPTAAQGAEVKIASVQSSTNQAASSRALAQSAAESTAEPQNKLPQSEDSEANAHEPVWRATAAAARLNQLYRDSADASTIKITWDNDRRQYLVKANEVEIVACDADTVLPDTVSGKVSDLLQATNRIRRQMGNAQPLSSIEGDPNGFNQVSLGPISLRISGYASWYGPGFEGAYSASGERFNAEALTAAHPSLPFGTQIRVTNMDNGASVVVRVNDRGPYARDRVIDLSTGAARVIGLIQAGVAPVKLEVLGAVQAAAR